MYVQDDEGQLVFHPQSEPSADEVADIAIMVAHKVLRALELDDGEDEDPLALEQPLLAHCYGAAVTGRQAFGPHRGKPVIRRIDADRRQTLAGRKIAEAEGFQVSSRKNDRQAVFALCRYLTRPPLANERLERLSDGRVGYRLQRRFATVPLRSSCALST